MGTIDTTEEYLSTKLDDVLRQFNDAKDEARRLERIYREASGRSADYEEEAQRLRLALLAIGGYSKPDLGEANKLNSARSIELRKEAES